MQVGEHLFVLQVSPPKVCRHILLLEVFWCCSPTRCLTSCKLSRLVKKPWDDILVFASVPVRGMKRGDPRGVDELARTATG